MPSLTRKSPKKSIGLIIAKNIKINGSILPPPPKKSTRISGKSTYQRPPPSYSSSSEQSANTSCCSSSASKKGRNLPTPWKHMRQRLASMFSSKEPQPACFSSSSMDRYRYRSITLLLRSWRREISSENSPSSIRHQDQHRSRLRRNACFGVWVNISS